MTPIKNETKEIKATLKNHSKFDSLELEKFFEEVRKDEKKMEKLIRAFCETYLIDAQQRPLRLRPLQIEIVVKSLTHPKGNDKKQRKMAILAPRGCGKSWALSISVIIWMFFRRFRDVVFVIAPTEDQAALIFNYVYRHFRDNSFLNSLVGAYKLHNKPSIKMKGGTILRRAPIAPSNQGQAIRGQHPTFLVVDESPLISDSLFVDNVEPSIVANKAPFINLGTPKSKENHMFRYLYDESYAETFERQHFTWRDAIIKGEAYTAPYDEEEMLNKMMEWGEDSMHWQTEYECEFIESVSNIFNTEQLRKCFDNYTFIQPDNTHRTKIPNCCVGVDIGKSVNSTVISVWATEKSDTENIARLIYIEEIGPKSGGHDIPYQRARIMEIANGFGASRVIIDATGIGGAFEQEIRLECIPKSIQFTPFIFTGGPKGTKTYAYRDYVQFVQKGLVRVPNPENLSKAEQKLMYKWYNEHATLEYVLDHTQKSEKISAPTGKHDDYCDSSVLGIHGCLGMLPAQSSFASVQLGGYKQRGPRNEYPRYSIGKSAKKSMGNFNLPPRGL